MSKLVPTYFVKIELRLKITSTPPVLSQKLLFQLFTVLQQSVCQIWLQHVWQASLKTFDALFLFQYWRITALCL